MLIKEKIGKLDNFSAEGRNLERLPLEWWECSKRILHKRTTAGREVTLKFLREAQVLQQDDVLYADNLVLIAVDILDCDALVLKPSTMYEMAFAGYEIGNKHLPLFYEDGRLLLPFDAPTHKLLQAAGLTVSVEKRKLSNPLRTTVSPHAHNSNESLFSKILRLTTPANE